MEMNIVSVNYFDNEKSILEWFRNDIGHELYIPVNGEDCKKIYTSLVNNKEFSEWIDSSGKSDPPPDFYNPKAKMMMDIMRVDDHGHINEDGKYINPVNQQESKIQRELRSGVMKSFPNIEIFVNAVTDLPGKEDHNYDFYLENFKRTIAKHIRSIPLYTANHPDYQTIFFVFDESSGYVVAADEETASRGVRQGERFLGSPYVPFVDKRFAEVFLGTDIDYLIWYTPFNDFETDMPLLPNVCIYDVKNLSIDSFEDYPKSLIMSTEE